MHRALRFLVILSIASFLFKANLKAQDISKLIDSIETQNLYAHDTVKIKNYIYIHETLQGRDLDTSLYFINKAFSIDSLSETSNQKAYLLLLKAQILDDSHKYNEALSIYKKSLSLAEKQKDKKLIIDIYNSMGILHLNMNLLDDAFSYFMIAMKYGTKSANPEFFGKIYINIGYILQLQGKYQKALEYFELSHDIYKSINDLDGMASATNNIGTMYAKLCITDSVLFYYNKAIKIYEELGDKKGQSFPIFNIGETYYEMKDYKKAVEYIRKSYEIDKEFNDTVGMATSLHFLGKIYSTQGNYNYGLRLYKQALDFNRNIDNKFLMKDIHYDISENYLKLDNYKEALYHYKLFSQLKDSIFNIETSNTILELETKYQNDRQQSEIKLQKMKLDQNDLALRQSAIQKMLFLGGFFILLVISIIIYRNYRLKYKSNELLIKQKQQIESQNNKITSSIQYAKLIQTAALPPYDLLRNIFSQHFVLFLPRDIVSGDFFWATQKDGQSVIACADCTGHGVPGAFMSMLGVSFLTEIVNRTDKLSANHILEHLRQNIIESLHQTGKIGESRDGMDIALCIINKERDQMEYAGAFIPLIIVRDNNIVQIPADKMPIGVHDETLAPFTSHKVKLQKDDMVYLFTDGYADQFGGPFNKKFKVQPFLSLLLAQHTKSLVQQREILYDTIMSWKSDSDQVDDILVMGFRV